MTPHLLLAAGGGEHGSFLLDPHGFGLVFWTGLVFAIVVVVLYKLAWGPLLQALQQREEAITGSIRTAEETRAEAERLRQKYEADLENIRQQAQAIIDEGNADKKRIIAEAHAKAQKDADEIRARAERDVTLAKQKALAEVKQSAATLGLLVAEKVIRAEVDAAKHRAVIDEAIASYERA